MPKLSILIATLAQRQDRFVQLVDSILDQIGRSVEVEVVAYWNNGEVPLGDIRQTLLESARGDYVCFVDDDDELPDYYCDKILEAVEKSPDYVGWRMQLYVNGEKQKPTYHSLRYDKWSDDDDGYYRDVSHLNPIKRELALKESFKSERGVAEDAPWASRMRKHLATEEYIGDVMYHYRHSADDSHWRGDGIVVCKHERPDIRHPQFRYVEGGV